MAEVRGDRILTRIEAMGTSRSRVADACGLKQPSITRLINGETRETGKLHELANALETTPEYLVGLTDDPSPGAVAERRITAAGETPERSTYVELQEIDLAYGMGGTYLDDIAGDIRVTAESREFPLAWLRQFTRAAPDQLFFARGSGDSMMPTLLDSDIVLIDRSQDSVRMRDQIWAVAIGGVGAIKRLRPQPDGSVAILSDNPSVPEDKAVDDELFVIGRVVAIIRKV